MKYEILVGNCLDTLKTLKDKSVNCCVTSPPYFGLRDYGTAEWEGGNPDCDHIDPYQNRGQNTYMQSTNNNGQGTSTWKVCKKCGAKRIDEQIGLEDRPEDFINTMVEVFKEVKRVLRDDGTLWLNLGDTYDNNKNLLGMPFRTALALQQDGWYLRQDIIWHKPNPMPESVRDRCTKSHEYIFLLSKSSKYYYDHEAIKENSVNPKATKKRLEKPCMTGPKHESGGYSAIGAKHTAGIKKFDGKRNKRSVWIVNTKPYKEAHFATYPVKLIEPCILAGCPVGGTVLDPFGGAGTTALVANQNNRNAILCELNESYVDIIKHRLSGLQMSLNV
jgi:DNA modification methylase